VKTRILILLIALVLASGLAPATAQTDTQGAQVTEDLKALMLKTMEAWATLDPANAAQFYDTEAKHVFYDAAPLKYIGWNEYAEGSRKFFATLKSLKITPENDIQTHRRGNMAWGTATWQFEIVPKEGKTLNPKGRYTVVWEKRGDKWLIVHEHASVPWEMPAAPAKP
jgi:ketosteroid isomerase-like protein